MLWLQVIPISIIILSLVSFPKERCSIGCQYVCIFSEQKCEIDSDIYTGELPEPKPMVTEDNSYSNYCDHVVTTDNEIPPLPPKLFDLSESSVPPQTLDPSAPPVPPKLVDFSVSF